MRLRTLTAVFLFACLSVFLSGAEDHAMSGDAAGALGTRPPKSAAKAPPEGPYEMRVEFDRRVKMRDGVELSADVYRPEAPGRFPVILRRTPYVKAGGSKGTQMVERIRRFVSHGYVFVAMDERGRGDSDGKFVPYRTDGPDGYDAIEWCAEQAWSNGKVGTFGGSYEGKNQWIAAVQEPPHLVTMIALVTPSDPFVEWPTGLPLPMDMSWYHFTAGHVNQNEDAVNWMKVYSHLPLYTMDEAAGRPMKTWKDQFEHARLDSWWEAERYQNHFDRVRVPVLHISGWYDDEQVGTPLNYIGMTTKGPAEFRHSQKLLMGPWPHAVNSTSKLGDVDFGASAVIDLDGYMIRWYDSWLKGVDNGIRSEPPVHIFVMGENRWDDENEWPIARTKSTNYYLHSGGRANSLLGDGILTTGAPATEPADSYYYDPKNPVPFITDPSFAQIGGPDDYRPVERRDDVLVYSTEPVTEDTEVCGPIRAELYAASSARDTDFMLKLVDVWPDGYAERLSDGMVRARFRESLEHPELIEPGRIYKYSIDAWNTCETFKKGHRIRVEISSSAFPKYDRNPNTGEELGMTANTQAADQKIYHDGEHRSHVVLPIVPPKQ